jgi:hypothetical protein
MILQKVLFTLPELPLDRALQQARILAPLKPDARFTRWAIKHGHLLNELRGNGPLQRISSLSSQVRFKLAIFLSRWFLRWHDRPLLIGSCPFLLRCLSHQKINFQNLVWFQNFVLARVPFLIFLSGLYLSHKIGKALMSSSDSELAWMCGLWIRLTTYLAVLALGTYFHNMIVLLVLKWLMPTRFTLKPLRW